MSETVLPGLGQVPPELALTQEVAGDLEALRGASPAGHVADLSSLSREPPEFWVAQTLAGTDGWPDSGNAEADIPTGDGDQVRLQWMTRRISERQSATLAHLKTVLWSILAFRWVGWLLLFLFALDLATIVYELKLADANSELKGISQLVDRVPLPLLGLVLVFWGGSYGRTQWGLVVLKALSWAGLVFGVTFVLMAPLAAVNGQRIQYEQLLSLQADQRQFDTGWADAKKRLEATATPEAFNDWVESVAKRRLAPADLAAFKDMGELHARGALLLNQSLQRKREELTQAYRDNRWRFFLHTLRLTGGAFLAGGVFIYIFRATGWVRKVRVTLGASLLKRVMRWRLRRKRRGRPREDQPQG